MVEGLSEIKANLENLFSLFEKELLEQRREILALSKRVKQMEDYNLGRQGLKTTVEAKVEVKPEEEEEDVFEVVDVRKRGAKEFILGDVFSLSSSVGDSVKLSSPAWMVDLPGNKVDNVANAISLNDRILFIRELFDYDSEQFSLTIDRLNGMDSLAEGINYLRAAFPNWDEESDSVYRFYMVLRRKFRG